MKNKLILFVIITIILFLIPVISGNEHVNETDFKDDFQIVSNNLGVKIIRPKSGYLYLFDVIELPIPSQSTIIIGDITCVAEQIPVYPYTVKWEFTDWKYGVYKFPSDTYNEPYWSYTYTNFNFGELKITASFENIAGTVMSSESIFTKKFL